MKTKVCDPIRQGGWIDGGLRHACVSAWYQYLQLGLSRWPPRWRHKTRCKRSDALHPSPTLPWCAPRLEHLRQYLHRSLQSRIRLKAEGAVGSCRSDRCRLHRWNGKSHESWSDWCLSDRRRHLERMTGSWRNHLNWSPLAQTCSPIPTL